MNNNDTKNSNFTNFTNFNNNNDFEDPEWDLLCELELEARRFDSASAEEWAALLRETAWSGWEDSPLGGSRSGYRPDGKTARVREAFTAVVYTAKTKFPNRDVREEKIRRMMVRAQATARWRALTGSPGVRLDEIDPIPEWGRQIVYGEFPE